jgi:hypothetical protein
VAATGPFLEKSRGQGTCIPKSECGCVVVHQDNVNTGGVGTDYVFAGAIRFGEAKGMIEKRISLSVTEDGIETTAKVFVRTRFNRFARLFLVRSWNGIFPKGRPSIPFNCCSFLAFM